MVVLLDFVNKKTENIRKLTQSDKNYIKKSQESYIEKAGNFFQL